MTMPKFSLARIQKTKNHDLVLLPFSPKGKALFSVADAEKSLGLRSAVLQSPKKTGDATTISRHVETGKNRLVRAVRLDTKHVTLAIALARAVATALAIAQAEGLRRVVVLLDGKPPALAAAAQEGALVGGYVYDEFLSTKAKPIPVAVLLSGNLAQAKRDCKQAAIIVQKVNFARDILNAPPNAIHPVSLAKLFRKVGTAAGMKVTVWDEKRIRKERCGALSAVGQGASQAPRMVIGEYGSTRKGIPHLCLVGKGVTFDTGGYCLKLGAGQIGMKKDMGGAAMMFGAACAIARLRLPIRLTVITPLAENDISANAFHTEDILRTRSGITVEVGNTDAEGRLILADALTLAGERKPDYLIDAATLTGACVVALGEDVAAAFGTNASFTRKLIQAGSQTGEPFWELPLFQPYAKMLKSTVADTSNMAGGSRWGGAITAALFLQKFVAPKQRWIHCDIAGPGIKDTPSGHFGAGAKGFGVKTIVALARQIARKK